MSDKPSRPRGVTILGYLFFIASILGLIGGIILVLGMGAALFLAPMIAPLPTFDIDPMVLFGILFVLGIILLIISAFYIKVGRSLLKGKPGARRTASIVVAIGLVIDIISRAVGVASEPSQAAESIGGAMITLVLNVIIIAYLQKPSIKEYFATRSLE